MRRLAMLALVACSMAACATPPAREPTTVAALVPPYVAETAGWQPAVILTAYFGRNARAHPVDPQDRQQMRRQVELVSEQDWESFYRAEVLPALLALQRDGAGFTMHEAAGHWRDAHGDSIERSKVVTVVLALGMLPQAQGTMASIAARYAARFHQHSVLLTAAVGQSRLQGAAPHTR